MLDVHWYPEAHGTNNIRITEQDNRAATVAARLQAPRSLWDPTYTESSWITQYSTLRPDQSAPATAAARSTTNYPGTKLAITEYNYGGGNHISGGIAEADVLGIFGREDVFAANEWPLAADESFIGGAFSMFRNYDGANGDLRRYVDPARRPTTCPAPVVYASLDSTNPNVMTIVAINKTSNSRTAGISLAHTLFGSSASVYQLTSASSTPQSAGTIAITDPTNFEYTMLPYSVTTLRVNLLPAPAATSTSFNFETAPNTIQIGFNSNVFASLDSGDLHVTQQGGSDIAATLVDYNTATNTATFTLPTPLPDGNFIATINAADVTDLAGRPLAGNVSYNFSFLMADANNDGHVNLLDFNILAANFNQSNRTFSQGDFNYDGQTNLLDFNILAARFNTALAATAPTVALAGLKGAGRMLDSLRSDVLA